MRFGEFAERPDAELDVLTGALLIAKDEYPELDFAETRAEIAALARPLAGLGLGAKSPLEQALALAAHLYEREGFHGNVDDYYDPKNSYLNQVLSRRTGIPLSLALVYSEVAKSVGVAARGVGFPGHFLVRIEASSGGVPLFVDAFDRGSLLDRDGLLRLWRRASGSSGGIEARWLEPAAPRDVLARMLGNLKAVYAMRADFSRLLVVLDRLIELVPESAADVRDRGFVAARLGASRAALADLQRYLELAPVAGDVAEVRKIVAELESKKPEPLN